MAGLSMNTDKAPFPLVWDNTLRGHFVSCPQAAYWGGFQHYKSTFPNIHLHAGKAWASALETTRLAFYRNKIPQAAAVSSGLETLIQAYGDFDCPPTVYKDLPRLIKGFIYYFQAFPLDKDPVQPHMGRNGPMVEFSFALPLDETLLHPETGEPIIYAGRADMVATYAGALGVFDDKTTGQLGAKWAGQWDRRAQFSGYTWAGQQMGLNLSQVIVRGIALKKDSYDHAQCILVRTKQHITEWHTQMVRDIRRAIVCWQEDYWDKSLDEACNAYGGCVYKQPCSANNPEPWLKANFIRREWNPVTRTEIFHENLKA